MAQSALQINGVSSRITGHEGTWGKRKFKLHSFEPLQPRQVNGQPHTQACLPPRKEPPVTIQYEILGLQSRSGCFGEDINFTLAGIRTPYCPIYNIVTTVCSLCYACSVTAEWEI